MQPKFSTVQYYLTLVKTLFLDSIMAEDGEDSIIVVQEDSVILVDTDLSDIDFDPPVVVGPITKEWLFTLIYDYNVCLIN